MIELIENMALIICVRCVVVLVQDRLPADEKSMAEIETRMRTSELIRRLLQRQYALAALAAAGADGVGGDSGDVDALLTTGNISEDDNKDDRKRGDARRCFYHAVNCW
jgi:hypothetical protein